MYLIKKQLDENEQELKGKENQVDQEQIRREQARLLKIMKQEEEQIQILNESTKDNISKYQDMKQTLQHNKMT